MKILVLNNGSTSARFELFDMDKNITLVKGGSENIGTPNSYFKIETKDGIKYTENVDIQNYDIAFNLMLEILLDKKISGINSVLKIDVIGHRVVHGGQKYTKAVIIDKDVINDIKELSSLAPLHNLSTINTIKSCDEYLNGIKNIAVFDTAFHSTIPKENYLYAIPNKYYEKYGIRKYGFHGTSYKYVLDRYSDLMKINKEDINSVICHMGGGCSMCTIKNGKSYDTTMEFSPLSGLIMASRSGSIDPSIIPYIMEKENITAKEIINILNEKSGYLAISNDKDAKKIVERSEQNDEDAILLRKMINRDFKKNLLAMMSNLAKVDSIILTGGMNTKNHQQREMLMSGLENFGIKIDTDINRKIFDQEAVISTADSKIPIFVIPTNEELEIANQCKKLIKEVK